MSDKKNLKFDEIGYWSEIKLDIIRDYAAAYSKILSAQKKPALYHVYIDAFAGAGIHISRKTGCFVPGSPVNALHISPPFREYYLIDIDQRKVDALSKIALDRSDVHIYSGDCNAILLERVFPNVLFGQYRRGLCLLDPYGLDLKWSVIQKAGSMKSIDMFLNFPVADINRNVLWHHPEGVDEADINRMNEFWGDETWRQIAYTTKKDLFGYPEKEANEAVAEGFRQRLQEVAGFANVPKPLPMRNSKGAIVYYLFLASQRPVAANIIKDIFKKYQKRGTNSG